MKTLLLIAALLAPQVHALELKPGTEQTLVGQVSNLRPDRTFILTTGDGRVLVYARADQVAALQDGATVTVRGMVPKDWVRLAVHELQAIQVRPQ